MTEVSLFRLYLLRAMYALLLVGLGLTVWPALIVHPPGWPLMNGVVCSLLGALAVLAAFGLRYPLRMLPLLVFELVWKFLWLVAIALPLWLDGRVDARTWETIRECLLGVILVPIVLPWGYLLRHFVTRPGERWTGRSTARPSSDVPAA